jgi:hypothetical protein
MKTTIKINISKEVIRKMDKAAHRKVLIEAGIYNLPKHKVHKGDKDYTRKVKHKKNFLED